MGKGKSNGVIDSNKTLSPYRTLYVKQNLWWIMDLKTLKIIEKSVSVLGKIFEHILSKEDM